MKFLILSLSALLLSGCQFGYIMKSGLGQMRLINDRVPVSQALENPDLDLEKKNKLELAIEARQFAEKELHLTPTKNYTSYVELGRPYVTYVVSAAHPWELKQYQWSYPLVGKMPYKGYFDETDAKAEELDLQKQFNLDTYLRGVSAYSTLGWFNDPILSSMLRYQDYDLVNTIIHETVHATLYIKHQADFNERLATFLGNKGAELFYLHKEGPSSPTLDKVKKDNLDSKMFSQFITKELKDLEDWYLALPPDRRSEELRQERFKEIQVRFVQTLEPTLKTNSFHKFKDLKLNNARLLIYKTYMQDLEDFELLYNKVGRDFSRFIAKCKELEKSKDPAQELKSWLVDTAQN